MTKRTTATALAVGLLVAGVGCGNDEAEPLPAVQSNAQEVRAGTNEDGDVLLGVDILVTDGDGQGIPCGVGEVEVLIEISRNGPNGPWTAVDSAVVESSCDDSGTGDLALVLDNSGSLEGMLDVLRQGAQGAADQVLAGDGRVALVRVSTNATILTGLSDSTAEVEGAVDELFVTNGWTALWDGVRMGNETLGLAANADGPGAHADVAAFCGAVRKQGILLFTDGAENNSSDQMLVSAEYSGDGLDTLLEDLHQLSVGGATTPIYTVGLGDEIDSAALSELSAATGGRSIEVDNLAEVDDVLEMVAEYFEAAHRMCIEVPSHLCGSLDVRITHTWTDGVEQVGESSVHHVDVPCDARVEGRVATILLTMDASETTETALLALEANSVDWVSPVDAPRVLFVLDDFHHGENEQDTQVLFDRLVTAGYDAEYMLEPTMGITPEDVAGFDVVWFSNPGYPMDDATSFDTLLQHSQAGGGVVLQGDDMSWSYGHGFSTAPLTRLDHVDNGTSYCGVGIDNGSGGRYQVTLTDQPHPLVASIESLSFLYGDDIDTATPQADTEVLAWADVDGVSNCDAKPVITVYSPPGP